MTTADLYCYRAIYRSNFDGDSIRMDLDLGCSVWLRNEVLRLARINCEEMNSQDPAKRLLAVQAQERVAAVLLVAVEIIVRTIKDRREKYGRLLADVWVLDGSDAWTNLNDRLLAEGLAVISQW